jgi:purine-binding chemotaxis protein CheW
MAHKNVQLLTFTLANEIYAIDVISAREVLDFAHITPIPKTPPWIRGVLNLRGNVVPVLDMKHKLGMGPTQHSRDVCVLILEIDLDGEKTLVGVLADSVREVIEVNTSQIDAPPNFGGRVSTEYILGVGRRNDRLFVLLDVAKIFVTSEIEMAQLAADEQAAQTLEKSVALSPQPATSPETVEARS